MRRILGTAALLLLMGTGYANSAVVDNFGVNPNSAAGFFSNDPNGGPNIGGLFNDFYEFTLSGSSFFTVASATNSYPGGSSTTDFITNFAAAVFQTVGIPGGGDDILKYGPAFAAIGSTSQALSGSGILGPGSYYLQIAGNAGTTAGYGGNFAVSAVPVPAALPLFGTALAGLAALKYRRRRRAT